MTSLQEDQEEDPTCTKRQKIMDNNNNIPNGIQYIVSESKLTSEETLDGDRWIIEMPSLSDFSSSEIKELNLYKNRYITKLHPSICDLASLQILSLQRCERLIELPTNIGNVHNLQILDLTDTSELVSLPESIGQLKK
jgi:Leucine-rich repeat (LRR) protein